MWMKRFKWVVSNVDAKTGKTGAFNSSNIGTSEYKCYLKKQENKSGLFGAAARAKAEAEKRANMDRRYFVFQVRPTGKGQYEKALMYYDSEEKYNQKPGFPNGRNKCVFWCVVSLLILLSSFRC